ncbi:hypothetical protein [Streptomyces sp. NPDC006134]|uniref:hypothetical protein n=1 Tax=Streptomyces TaxID=1883 RepID=UPI0033C9ADF7
MLREALSHGGAASNASAASAARGGSAGPAVGAGAFLRKDLAVVFGLAGEPGLALGPLEHAARSLEDVLTEER